MLLTTKRNRVGTILTWLLSGLGLIFFGSPAGADGNSVGVSFTTDRNAHDLDVPKDAKLKVTASHCFDSGVILGASGEYTNNAFSDSATVKLKGTVGYRAALSDRFSLTGSA